MTNFEICQLLATPGSFEYSGQNHRCSENQFFLDEGATRLGGFRWAGPYAIWWYHFWGGCDTLRGVRQGIEHESSVFLTHLRQLRRYSTLTDLIKNQSIGVDIHTLVWIFEYITDWLFVGALNADFLRIFDISKKS